MVRIGGQRVSEWALCARCDHSYNLHRLPVEVRPRVVPPVCHRFERKAPWWLRAATWLFGGRSHA